MAQAQAQVRVKEMDWVQVKEMDLKCLSCLQRNEKMVSHGTELYKWFQITCVIQEVSVFNDISVYSIIFPE